MSPHRMALVTSELLRSAYSSARASAAPPTATFSSRRPGSDRGTTRYCFFGYVSKISFKIIHIHIIYVMKTILLLVLFIFVVVVVVVVVVFTVVPVFLTQGGSSHTNCS